MLRSSVNFSYPKLRRDLYHGIGLDRMTMRRKCLGKEVKLVFRATFASTCITIIFADSNKWYREEGCRLVLLEG